MNIFLKSLVVSCFLYFFYLIPVEAQSTKEAAKYGQFIYYLSKYYVDTINTEQLVDEAIKWHLSDLDPHSTYISKEEVQKMNEPLKGNFEGIGISFNILNDTLFVITPIPGGPSEKVGILSGDRIIKVDGKNIAGIGLTNEDVFSLLRGDKGTKVRVSVYRRNYPRLQEFTITRDKIPINSLDAAYIVKNNIGYIKLNRFSLTTIEEFYKASIDLIGKGAENLILDLTGNAGGYLDVAVLLSDQFLDDEKLIVYTKGMHSSRNEYFASKPGLFENGNVVILIDEGSASASEIVSGAVQDWDRGIIIGRRSFGKGLVQRQLELLDGSMVRLTTAKYYTPSGRLIQKPYGEGNDTYEREIVERYEHGEFVHKDSIQFPDSLRYETLLNKRTVFGGGGIMPDIFIPLDTTYYSDYFRELVRTGVLNQFVLNYVDKNRQKLQKKYPDFSAFNSNYFVTENMYYELVEYAEDEGVKRPEDISSEMSEKFTTTLKAYVARDLWTTSEFYEVINQTDDNFLKAVEVMSDWDNYSRKLLQ
ncbi:MAG: S41 family peptidase [Bacteroidales bacterium]|nr:S41 family peptidase [Bacteroidales bacterium]